MALAHIRGRIVHVTPRHPHPPAATTTNIFNGPANNFHGPAHVVNHYEAPGRPSVCERVGAAASAMYLWEVVAGLPWVRMILSGAIAAGLGWLSGVMG